MVKLPQGFYITQAVFHPTARSDLLAIFKEGLTFQSFIFTLHLLGLLEKRFGDAAEEFVMQINEALLKNAPDFQTVYNEADLVCFFNEAFANGFLSFEFSTAKHSDFENFKTDLPAIIKIMFNPDLYQDPQYFSAAHFESFRLKIYQSPVGLVIKKIKVDAE